MPASYLTGLYDHLIIAILSTCLYDYLKWLSLWLLLWPSYLPISAGILSACLYGHLITCLYDYLIKANSRLFFPTISTLCLYVYLIHLCVWPSYLAVSVAILSSCLYDYLIYLYLWTSHLPVLSSCLYDCLISLSLLLSQLPVCMTIFCLPICLSACSFLT